MRKTILTALVATLVATVTVQAAPAHEHHRARIKSSAVANERLRNSNAYFAPDFVPDRYAPPSSGYDGALGAGMAGH